MYNFRDNRSNGFISILPSYSESTKPRKTAVFSLSSFILTFWFNFFQLGLCTTQIWLRFCAMTLGPSNRFFIRHMICSDFHLRSLIVNQNLIFRNIANFSFTMASVNWIFIKKTLLFSYSTSLWWTILKQYFYLIVPYVLSLNHLILQ